MNFISYIIPKFILGLIFYAAISCTTVNLEPWILQDAVLGDFYFTKLKLVDAGSPIRKFKVSHGALPKGLQLNLIEGVWNELEIKGTPEVDGDFHFQIEIEVYGTNFGIVHHRYKRSLRVLSEKK